jgi:hypothetical protein
MAFPAVKYCDKATLLKNNKGKGNLDEDMEKV